MIQLELDLNPKRKWTKAEIAEKLEQSYAWQLRAFYVIWNKTVKFTVDGIGFNKYDYPKAEELWKFKIIYGEFTPLHKQWLRTRLPKYARQLVRLANEG